MGKKEEMPWGVGMEENTRDINLLVFFFGTVCSFDSEERGNWQWKNGGLFFKIDLYFKESTQ